VAQQGLAVVCAQRGVGQAWALWGQGWAVAISVGSHRSREARRTEADQREALVMTWLRGDLCVCIVRALCARDGRVIGASCEMLRAGGGFFYEGLLVHDAGPANLASDVETKPGFVAPNVADRTGGERALWWILCRGVR
jgi:hypothetical protein